jgi:hypothetical protein
VPGTLTQTRHFSSAPSFSHFNWQYGTDGDDWIQTGSQDDVVYAYGGNDTIYTGDGYDTVYAGTGDDFVFGGTGIDALYGEDGNDTLVGDSGNDTLNGGNGNDLLWGGTGADRLTGGPGRDTFIIREGDSPAVAGGADTITDFDPLVFGDFDQLDVPDSVLDRPHNFVFQTGATSIEAAAALAEDIAPHLGTYGHGLLGAGGVGAMLFLNAETHTSYLVMDVDANGTFEAGVVLEGYDQDTSVLDYSYTYDNIQGGVATSFSVDLTLV